MKLSEPTNTSTIFAENLIDIRSVASEIWPGKVKSHGDVYSSRCVYSAKYVVFPRTALRHCGLLDSATDEHFLAYIPRLEFPVHLEFRTTGAM